MSAFNCMFFLLLLAILAKSAFAAPHGRSTIPTAAPKLCVSDSWYETLACLEELDDGKGAPAIDPGHDHDEFADGSGGRRTVVNQALLGTIF